MLSSTLIGEAAYVPDELYHALRPMLATTKGAIASTPRVRAGTSSAHPFKADLVMAFALVASRARTYLPHSAPTATGVA